MEKLNNMANTHEPVQQNLNIFYEKLSCRILNKNTRRLLFGVIEIAN